MWKKIRCRRFVLQPVTLSSQIETTMFLIRAECYCDPLCVFNNECCVDYVEICNTTTPTTTTVPTTTTPTTTTTSTTITLIDFRADPRTYCREPRFAYLFTTTTNINSTMNSTFNTTTSLNTSALTTTSLENDTYTGNCPGAEREKGCRYPSRQGNLDCEGANNICSCDWDGGDCCDANLLPESEYLRRKREAEEGLQ